MDAERAPRFLIARFRTVSHLVSPTSHARREAQIGVLLSISFLCEVRLVPAPARPHPRDPRVGPRSVSSLVLRAS